MTYNLHRFSDYNCVAAMSSPGADVS